MPNAFVVFLLQPAITAALLAGVALIAKETVSTFIKEGIASQFREEQERYATELRWQEGRRQKAAQIAGVISDWLSLTYDPAKLNDPAAYLALQRSYWELALWLDADTLRLLNGALLLKRGAHYKEALAAVRMALVGSELSPIQPNEFVHWPIPGFAASPYDQAGPQA